MKLRFAAIIICALFLGACVSKKKYKQMSELAQSKSSEKDALEEVLNRLAVENDSLNKWLVELDSLYRTEKARNEALANAGKKEGRGYVGKLKPKLISAKEEYEKKALFVYSFIQYIVWPVTNSESFNIGIVGDSPIKNSLSNYVAEKRAGKLPIKVETYQPDKVYHILFFSEGGLSSFNKVKNKVITMPVLLITENALLEKIGSHVSLYVDGAKVKFSANKNALNKSKLKVSNSFYSLAD